MSTVSCYFVFLSISFDVANVFVLWDITVLVLGICYIECQDH